MICLIINALFITDRCTPFSNNRNCLLFKWYVFGHSFWTRNNYQSTFSFTSNQGGLNAHIYVFLCFATYAILLPKDFDTVSLIFIDSHVGTCLLQSYSFRRGTYPSTIYSLSFQPSVDIPDILVATSSSGSLHVFFLGSVINERLAKNCAVILTNF